MELLYFIFTNANWLGTAFSISGIFFSAKKNILCWPIWFVGCIFWLIYVIPIGDWPQIILWIVFSISNIYGWYEWAKKENKRDVSKKIPIS
jgi:nicotinamide mononucleotide transporter